MGEMMDTSFLIKLSSQLSGILWLSLLRISALSAWTTPFFALEQAGCTNRQRCRAVSLPSMPPGAQEEGCASRSRSASRPCRLQNFTENVLHHLASVAQSTQSNFLVLSCQCGSNCKPFVLTNTELSEVRRQCW